MFNQAANPCFCFTPDRHLCWLHSKKIKLSTSTAVQYAVIVWLSEYSKYTV